MNRFRAPATLAPGSLPAAFAREAAAPGGSVSDGQRMEGRLAVHHHLEQTQDKSLRAKLPALPDKET